MPRGRTLSRPGHTVRGADRLAVTVGWLSFETAQSRRKMRMSDETAAQERRRVGPAATLERPRPEVSHETSDRKAARRASVRVAEARRRVAQAERDHAAAILGYARIEAPFAGVVSRRLADTGAYVQPPAASSTADGPLFEVVRTDRVRAFADVAEADARRVAVGAPAGVRVAALGGRELQGRVALTSWLLDGPSAPYGRRWTCPTPKASSVPGCGPSSRSPWTVATRIRPPRRPTARLDWIASVAAGDAAPPEKG